MKPILTTVIGYVLCTCGFWLWLACPRAEAQPVPGDRDVQQRVDEERFPETKPGDPDASPRGGEPDRPGGRRHWREFRRPDDPNLHDARPRQMRPPGPRKDGPDSAPDFLTEKEREELMAFTKEHFPKMYELLRDSPRAHQRRMLRRVGWPMLRLLRLQQHDPQLAEKLIAEHKIEMELAQLKRDYRDFPSEAARENIKQKMRAILEQRFEIRQQRLELEIQALQKRLEEARERMARQEADRQKLIDAEVERLIDRLQDERMWGSSLPLFGEEPQHPNLPLGHPEPQEHR